MKKIISLTAGGIISIVFLFFALRKIEWGILVEAIGSANLNLLLAAILLRMVIFLLRSFRWNLILAPAGYGLGWKVLFSPLMVGFFGNYLLPAKAGELVRAYLLKRRSGILKSSILATIAVEKFLDMVILVSFLLSLFIIMPLPDWIGKFSLMAVLITIIFLAIFFAVLKNTDRIVLALTRIGSRFSQGLNTKIDYYTNAVKLGLQILRKGDHLGLGLIFSAMLWGVTVFILFLLGESLGLRLPPQAYILLVVIFNLSVLIPSLPGRLGTMEIVFIAVLAIFGVNPTEALTLAILFRVTHLLPLLIGYLLMVKEGFRLGSLPREEEAVV